MFQVEQWHLYVIYEIGLHNMEPYEGSRKR